MAGLVYITYRGSGILRKITWSWVANSSGAANGAFTPDEIEGIPLRVVTVPDSGAAPTDNYDIVINDSDGADILQAQGANRDTATTEQLGFDDTTAPLPWIGQLELQVTNAGSGNRGRVHLYYRRDDAENNRIEEKVAALDEKFQKLLKSKGIY